MIRILVLSDRKNECNRFKTIFGKNTYDLSCLSDESMIYDVVSSETPDVIIIDTQLRCLKNVNKRLKSDCNGSIIIFLVNENKIDKELLKYANAFLTDDMSDDFILSTININLRMRNSLEMLSNSNKDLADSLYRLNALYATSSQFSGTLDKAKLIQYMVEGMDKALSFSLTCTLSFCTEEEPVLILNSLYELSDELVEALKFRSILNYNSLFEGKKPPFEINSENLRVVIPG